MCGHASFTAIPVVVEEFSAFALKNLITARLCRASLSSSPWSSTRHRIELGKLFSFPYVEAKHANAELLTCTVKRAAYRTLLLFCLTDWVGAHERAFSSLSTTAARASLRDRV